jgi:hypothetical protein
MKPGVNFTDRNNIRDYVLAGQTNPTIIGERLKIDPKVVARFVKVELEELNPVVLEEEEEGTEEDLTDD